MRTTNPAIVYAPTASPASMGTLDECLGREGLYRCDDAVEAAADLLGSVAGRPVLRRALFFASSLWKATAFVTDGYDALGVDRTERLAAVGAVHDLGLELFVDGKPAAASWYRDGVRAVGFDRVKPVMAALLAPPAKPLLERWEALTPDWLWASSDSSGPRARLRIKELHEVDGLSFTRIAERLGLEGYVNPSGHRSWYTRSVREMYEAGL